jgi:hypothetical protein
MQNDRKGKEDSDDEDKFVYFAHQTIWIFIFEQDKNKDLSHEKDDEGRRKFGRLFKRIFLVYAPEIAAKA